MLYVLHFDTLTGWWFLELAYLVERYRVRPENLVGCLRLVWHLFLLKIVASCLPLTADQSIFLYVCCARIHQSLFIIFGVFKILHFLVSVELSYRTQTHLQCTQKYSPVLLYRWEQFNYNKYHAIRIKLKFLGEDKCLWYLVIVKF